MVRLMFSICSRIFFHTRLERTFNPTSARLWGGSRSHIPSRRAGLSRAATDCEVLDTGGRVCVRGCRRESGVCPPLFATAYFAFVICARVGRAIRMLCVCVIAPRGRYGPVWAYQAYSTESVWPVMPRPITKFLPHCTILLSRLVSLWTYLRHI